MTQGYSLLDAYPVFIYHGEHIIIIVIIIIIIIIIVIILLLVI